MKFDRTAVGLQTMIEDKLKRTPELALNSEAFNDFAFNSHPNVYLNDGIMQQLPINDLITIGFAPPTKDLFHPDGMRQVMQIMPDLLPSVLLRPGIY